MKKFLNNHFLSFFLLISVCLFFGCIDSAVKAPELKFAGVDVLGFDSKGAFLGISIEAYNPNSIQIGLASYESTIFINGREVSTQKTSGIVLEPNEKKVFLIQGYIGFENMLGTANEVFPDLIKGRASFDYKILGKFTGQAAGFNFSAPISSEGKVNITLGPLK